MVEEPVRVQNHETEHARRTWSAAILAALFLARLGFAALVYARPQVAIQNDSDRYVPIANAILVGEAYRWNAERPGELLNTVGYPLFLAGVFSTLGHEAGDIALAQLLLSGTAALLAYGVLTRRLSPAAGLGAGVVMLLDPLTILWSMTILTETLFAVLLGAGALILGVWADSRRRGWLLLSGMLVGLACLVRPVGMAVAVVWGIAAALYPVGPEVRRDAVAWIRVRRGVLFLLPAVALIVPWVIRNGILWDCPSLSSVDRVTMRDYIAAKIIVEIEHVQLEEAQARLQEADPGMCPVAGATYRQMILDNPMVYARLHAAATVPVVIATGFDRWLQYFGTPYQLPDLWRPFMDHGLTGLLAVVGAELRTFPQGLGAMAILTTIQLVMYVLASLGAIAAWRNGSAATRWYVYALIVGILVLLVTPGQSGHERFRVPMQPLFAILVGYWLAWRRRARRTEALAGTWAQG